jgi:hypothetical protein
MGRRIGEFGVRWRWLWLPGVRCALGVVGGSIRGSRGIWGMTILIGLGIRVRSIGRVIGLRLGGVWL